MASYLFRLPDVGEGVAEAEIAAWRVALGDVVKEDQPLLDVMTDKATVEITAPVSGLVAALHGSVGDRVAVGSTLIEFDLRGEESAAPPAPRIDPPPAPPASRRSANGSAQTKSTVFAAPATRRRARELDISLADVRGTGPGGRIRYQDLDSHISTARARPVHTLPPAATAVHERPIVGLRRAIAERMEVASRRIPHFSYVEEVDMTDLEALRAELNQSRSAAPKLTLLPFFVRALVVLRPEFPSLNALYDDEARVLREYEAVHMGIATQTPNGLMVPVVRHAEQRDLWSCAGEIQRVTEAARQGKAARDDLVGSTITLTSLGKLGGLAATPIIHHPQVAIIGPNKLIDRPVVRGGQIAIRTLMNVSASFDHRIVDGYEGARFVQRLKRLLEQPALLFLASEL